MTLHCQFQLLITDHSGDTVLTLRIFKAQKPK